MTMTDTSSAGSTPQGVLKFPTASPEPQPEMHRDYVVMLRAGLQVLNARVLLLLALLFGGGIWTYTVYDPSEWRFICACGFSVGVLWPVAMLYNRKG